MYLNLDPQYRQIQQIAQRLRIIGDELDADQRIQRYKYLFLIDISMTIFLELSIKGNLEYKFFAYYNSYFASILCFSINY